MINACRVQFRLNKHVLHSQCFVFSDPCDTSSSNSSPQCTSSAPRASQAVRGTKQKPPREKQIAMFLTRSLKKQHKPRDVNKSTRGNLNNNISGHLFLLYYTNTNNHFYLFAIKKTPFPPGNLQTFQCQTQCKTFTCTSFSSTLTFIFARERKLFGI